MKLTPKSADELATEPGLTGTELRVWLLTVDRAASAADIARRLQADPSNISAACRKLLTAGWIEVAEVVGKSKRYRARSERDPNAALPGQSSLSL